MTQAIKISSQTFSAPVFQQNCPQSLEAKDTADTLAPGCRSLTRTHAGLPFAPPRDFGVAPFSLRDAGVGATLEVPVDREDAHIQENLRSLIAEHHGQRGCPFLLGVEVGDFAHFHDVTMMAEFQAHSGRHINPLTNEAPKNLQIHIAWPGDVTGFTYVGTLSRTPGSKPLVRDCQNNDVPGWVLRAMLRAANRASHKIHALSAMLALAGCYKAGVGIAQDDTRAERILRRVTRSAAYRSGVQVSADALRAILANASFGVAAALIPHFQAVFTAANGAHETLVRHAALGQITPELYNFFDIEVPATLAA